MTLVVVFSANILVFKIFFNIKITYYEATPEKKVLAAWKLRDLKDNLYHPDVDGISCDNTRGG